MSAKPRFVHLRTHTDFSMIDGIAKVKPLVKACAADNMVALALTDFTNFCGVVRFYGETLSSGIKPIIGADVHVKSELCKYSEFVSDDWLGLLKYVDYGLTMLRVGK